MEHGAAIDNTRDEVAAKNRFDSFKLGKGLPSSIAQKHSHVRSHSRNASTSSSAFSLPFSISSKSTNAADMSTPINPAPPSKHNSHHRRRSSVSTRIESAEMMGVSIPDLPPSISEDNINLGEKDSIRRRALWALEGKPDVAFSKVEIPELSTPIMEKMMYDFATKSSQPQNTVPSYGPSINTLMANKRDSFKLLGASSSSKDQLHTLVEEEEEDDDVAATHEAETIVEPAALASPITPALAVTKATPARPRPAGLNLRPLSLTPENLVSTVSGLPTPSLTPSPRIGLKSLALVPSDDATNIMNTRQSTSPSPVPHRLSLNLNFSSESPTPASCSSEDGKGNRRSSISYKSSSSSSSSNGVAMNFAGLPTPEMTPVSFDRRYSMSIPDALRRRSSGSSSASGDEDSFPNNPTQSRPLSVSEQHFLFKSHNALLARITDLERALTVRRMSSGGLSANGSSRPVSIASDFSYSSEYGSGEPSDEMLRLVADLKAERDDLKRDVDGWRTRVGDLEKQLSVVAGRVESERREAWVARSVSGLLEVEKTTLERKLAGVDKTVLALEEEAKALKTENSEMKARLVSLEEELERVRQELSEEKRMKQEASVFNYEPTTPTPRTPEPRSRTVGLVKRGRGFTSVDSESSITDVEDSFESSPKFNFSLKAVEEDDEDVFSEEDNGLAGYEDEEESDISFHSSSSFDSEDDFPRSVSHLQTDVPASVTPNGCTSRPTSPPAVHAPRPTHAPRASLSKTWTFPRGGQLPGQTVQLEPEVDRFFGCLQDDNSDSSDSTPHSPSAYSYEKSKGLFASGFKYGGDDEDAPFFFPLGASVELGLPKGLDVVHEEVEEEGSTSEVDEDEDDEDMFGQAGGIQIIFTPPEADEGESFDSQRSPSPSPAKPSIPTNDLFDEDHDEDSIPFNFGRPLAYESMEEATEKTVFSAPPASKPFNFGRPLVSEPATEVKDVVIAAAGMITPPSSHPRHTEHRAPSPSSIPRSTTFKPSFSFTDMTTSTPPRSAATRVVSASNYSSNAFVTPPNKRGGAMPSFIPQPISSPSPLRSTTTTAKPKAASPSATFIPQAQRKPLMLANNNAKSQNVPSGAPHVNAVMNARSVRRSSDLHAAPAPSAHSEMKSVDLSDHFNIPTNISGSATTPTQAYPYPVQDRNLPSSQYSSVAPSPEAWSSSAFSIMSPFSSRVSLQTLTNFIPISWSQRSDAPASSYSCVESALKSDGVVARREPALRTAPLKRGFVSKEKQLEKLRSRLEREGAMKMRTSVSVLCNNCDDGEVSL